MSRENLEVVHRAVEALNRRDLEALAELCDEEFEFASVFTAVDAGRATYRGKYAWTTYSARMDEAWNDWRVEDLRVFDAGDDRIAAVFLLVGEGKNSGARVKRAVGATYKLRQGKLWRMRSYLNPQEALDAVGLRE